MKKVLVVCGNGIASSSIMVSILQDYLKEKKIDSKNVLLKASRGIALEKVLDFIS